MPARSHRRRAALGCIASTAAGFALSAAGSNWATPTASGRSQQPSASAWVASGAAESAHPRVPTVPVEQHSRVASNVVLQRWHNSSPHRHGHACGVGVAMAASGLAAAALTRGMTGSRRRAGEAKAIVRQAAANPAQTDEETWQKFVAWSSERGGKLDNVELARFDAGDGTLVRGLKATCDIAEGDTIMELPMTAVLEVVDPNTRNQDPTVAGRGLLKLLEETGEENAPYYSMLPSVDSADMATMPDFFTDEEIGMLQFPSVERKTLLRKRLCSEKAAEHGIDEDKLRWAVCTVAQRVFTIHSPVDGLLRLLLPGVDLANHDADSFHRLRVKWTLEGMFDGLFKVVAGSDISAGDEVRICYGGSPHRPDGCGGDCAGDIAWTNDQYLQRYGFVDRSLGTTMVDGKWLVTDEAAEVREALAQTSIAEDEALLEDSKLSVAAREAVGFRLHLKRALRAQEQADAASAKEAEKEASKPESKEGTEKAEELPLPA